MEPLAPGEELPGVRETCGLGFRVQGFFGLGSRVQGLEGSLALVSLPPNYAHLTHQAQVP